MVDKMNRTQKVAFIIFAQNESSVIRKTAENVCSVLRTSDALFVVADNCSDDTAQIAKETGARVIFRNVLAPQGKGAALVWFINNYQAQILKYDYLVILDADSLIPNDFVEKLNLQLQSGTRVAQCYISPINFESSPIATLIALSEIIEQTVFERIRSFLGLSVRLRGTGMIFDPKLLLELCPRIGTEVEDIALTLLLAEKRVCVKLMKDLIVFDPKPAERNSASRQRARWFRGQWNAFWNYRLIVFKLLISGPVGWSVINPVFLKPRWLKLICLTTIGLIFYWQPLIFTFFILLVCIELLFILIGMVSLPNRGIFFTSLIYIPGFVLMWIKGIFLSFKHRPWPRVRENLEKADDTKSCHQPIINL
jgi:cellulose synthase/poly-beta-1,6-N-acetylglucosamine synthase-like glycosyltransferase